MELSRFFIFGLLVFSISVGLSGLVCKRVSDTHRHYHKCQKWYCYCGDVFFVYFFIWYDAE